MIREKNHPTTTVPAITPAQMISTRQCNSLILRWVSATGAPSAIDAPPTVKVRTRYSTPSMVVLAYPSANSGSTTLVGTDIAIEPTRTVRTRLPSGLGALGAGGPDSRVEKSPRLLTESRRRSNWLYWSLVTPTHTQTPSVSTSTTTASAATITMDRSDNIRIGSRCNSR